MIQVGAKAIVSAGLSFMCIIHQAEVLAAERERTTAVGPLRVNPVNPRYFINGTGKAIYLTGSHTWSNFMDCGTVDPPLSFDFVGYLDFLQHYNHNFIRMWTFELTQFTYGNGLKFVGPFPWPRTGPGTALDSKRRFDLTKFNKEYFDRLRSRVAAARDRGIYVSIMLFNGHTVEASKEPWRWDGHPFNIKNNINGIDGDPRGNRLAFETHTLANPAVVALQEQYVRKVIDAVNDFDNVLYEIANETGSYSTEWQYHMVRYIKNYEASKAKRHPVGMTFQYNPAYMGSNLELLRSPADWISPNSESGYKDNPPTADGAKVILSDTDHLWGVGGNWTWVWKSFTRGLNPIYMDPYGDPNFPSVDESARMSMGYTLRYAKKMNLAGIQPHGELTSTGYALANPGYEYLIYSPGGTHRLLRWLDKSKLSKPLHWLQDRLGLTDTITVDLTGSSAAFRVEWFNPRTDETLAGGIATGGTHRTFTSPFLGDVVLYLTTNRTSATQ